MRQGSILCPTLLRRRPYGATEALVWRYLGHFRCDRRLPGRHSSNARVAGHSRIQHHGALRRGERSRERRRRIVIARGTYLLDPKQPNSDSSFSTGGAARCNGS
jgi:hypothetical protein